MDLKERVIEKFNAELGSNLSGLEKIQKFHEELLAERRRIEESLSLASTEAPSKVKAAIEGAEQISEEIKELQVTCKEIRSNIQERLSVNTNNAEVREIVEKVSQLDKSLSYLRFIKCIEDIGEQLEIALSSADDESAITLYSNLTEISNEIQSSSCHHLLNYVKETLHFWHSLLKEKYSAEYCEILKSLKWPFCGTNVSAVPVQSPETLARFKIITEYLFHLQLPEETTKPTVTSSLLTDFAPVSLPIALLVRPLRQRFLYHFTGAKQTNRHDKPEWFFTQILTWIKGHASWIKKNVQPVVDSLGFLYLDAKVEFVRALVQLAVEKLHSELPIALYDDALFAHLVDEALGFERELRETLFYPQSEPATVFVLTQAHIFVKWINMEKKYATEKMDAIFSSDTAWERISGPDSDGTKATECAEAFLTLLSTISDRYNHLPQPGHRLQFLELQLELIDDWRVRLLQLLHEDYENPLDSLMPRILNTLHYVSSVLAEWGVTVHFLQLHFFKKQCEAVETATDRGDDFTENVDEVEGSVFDSALALLERLEKEMITEISDSVALDVKAKSLPYRTDKWFAMQSANEVASLSVTPSGCQMFQELASRLHTLHEVLGAAVFNEAWRLVASQLDQYLLEEVVLVNQFNAGGAAQLNYDIFRNVFPLFGLYTSKPESYFPLMRESCILLNMLVGSAMLLLEALQTNDEDSAAEVLMDVGIYKMSPEIATSVLKTRTDLSTR